MWLENDWQLNVNEHVDDTDVTPRMDVIRAIENPGHGADAMEEFLTKPLHTERFYKIHDQMLCEHSNIDMLNATGTKKAKACCLDPSYVYLDTSSKFHWNINPDTVNNIHTVFPRVKSHSNGGVSRTNQNAKYGEFLGGTETWFQAEDMANIISFHKLGKKYPVTYIDELKIFVVHTRGLNVEDGLVLFK